MHKKFIETLKNRMKIRLWTWTKTFEFVAIDRKKKVEKNEWRKNTEKVQKKWIWTVEKLIDFFDD